MASANTSDHQPMPIHATRNVLLTFALQVAPIASTASRAMRSSVAQSPPLTPMPPMHSPPTMIGAPPSIAVQRSGPAANARPSAWLVSRSCPTAPLAEVHALVGGGADRLGGRGIQRVETAAVHALKRDQMSAGIDHRAGNRDPGGARLGDGGFHHHLRTLDGSGVWNPRHTWGPAICGVDGKIVRQPTLAGKAPCYIRPR